MVTDKTPAGNSTYPKMAVQWLNQALYFYQSLCLVDSKSLLYRHIRVAANRYKQGYDQRNEKDKSTNQRQKPSQKGKREAAPHTCLFYSPLLCRHAQWQCLTDCKKLL